MKSFSLALVFLVFGIQKINSQTVVLETNDCALLLAYLNDSNVSKICIKSGLTITCDQVLTIHKELFIGTGSQVHIDVTSGSAAIMSSNGSIKGDSRNNSKLTVGPNTDTAVEIPDDCVNCEIDMISIEGSANVDATLCPTEIGDTGIKSIQPCAGATDPESSINITSTTLKFFNTGIYLVGSQCGTYISNITLDRVGMEYDLECPGGPNCPDATNASTCSYVNTNGGIVLNGVSDLKMENVFHHRSVNSTTILMTDSDCNTIQNNNITTISSEQGGGCAKSFYCNASSSVVSTNNIVMVIPNVKCTPTSASFEPCINGSDVYGSF